MRVVTFNMLHGGLSSGLVGDGERLEERLAMAAAELGALEVDVVGLQEASAGRRRGTVARRLADALGFDAVSAPVMSRTRLGRLAAAVMRLDEGPAILSRFPIVASGVAPIRCGDPFARLLLCAEIAVPSGLVDVCSTHVTRSACQGESLHDLVQARRRDRPFVLLADLNATETAPALRRFLEAGFVDAFRAANPGVPGPTVWQPVRAAERLARRRVDYVLVAPAAAARVVASRVVLDTPRRAADGGVLWPSDHYGVLADLEIDAQK
jgi:endonuclease/exonuclease/phosphatase family metal-dependent hydrolase